MSAVKHQPATELPWHVGPLAGEIYSHPSGITIAKLPWPRRTKKLPDGYRTAEQRIVPNAAYVAHAANAYPKLIEQLRIEKQMLAAWFTKSSISGRMRDEMRRRVASINALLTELGEDFS